MSFESLKTFSTPLFIYAVMGIFIARIQLDKTNTHGFNWLQWLQFGVDVMRIVLLWPLVLFIEKSHDWLDQSMPAEETSQVKDRFSAKPIEATK